MCIFLLSHLADDFHRGRRHRHFQRETFMPLPYRRTYGKVPEPKVIAIRMYADGHRPALALPRKLSACFALQSATHIAFHYVQPKAKPSKSLLR